MADSTGRFISLEGGEGAGKSTQAKLLAKYLEDSGKDVLLTREPGGTQEAEAIRDLLVTGDPDRWDAMTETLLFQTARYHHYTHLIAPALAEGKWIVCDRYLDSTLVYQGVAKGIDPHWILELHRHTLGDAMPDLTLYFDLSAEEGLKRAQDRVGHETRFEDMELAFHQEVREGFLEAKKQWPERIVTIDASLSIEDVHSKVIEAVQPLQT